MLQIYDGLNYIRDAIEHNGYTLRTLYNHHGNLKGTDTVIWVWEGKGGNNRRRKIYPGYKKQRKVAVENIFEMVALFQNVMKHANVIQVAVPGYEGDDVIASFSRKYQDSTKIFIHSTDKDLRQLYGPNVAGMANPLAIEGKDIGIEYVRLYKTLVGDPSDNIKGIPNCGPKQFQDLDLDGLNECFLTDDLERQLPNLLLPLKPKCYTWAMANIQELRIMWEITGFYTVDDQQLVDNMIVGQPNAGAADLLLRQYLQ